MEEEDVVRTLAHLMTLVTTLALTLVHSGAAPEYTSDEG